jgi:predicted MPP superfamily phosphohydrolase
VKEEASKILRTLPREKAFYFFTSIGNYTGESAASLKEFADKIRDVNVKSLEFHLYRGDFEKWTAEVLQDENLASELRKLQKINLTGDAIRNELYTAVSNRLKQLTSQLQF